MLIPKDDGKPFRLLTPDELDEMMEGYPRPRRRRSFWYRFLFWKVQ